MAHCNCSVSLIRGDGIGLDVADAACEVVEAARAVTDGFTIDYRPIEAGAAYFARTGHDIEPGGEAAAGESDAIFLGAIGLPTIRYEDGTEISPHLRLRDRYQLYAGVRPVKSYPNTPRRLSSHLAGTIDLVILRESTEGLFYSAAVHGRSKVTDEAVEDTLRISRGTTEKLHRFGFRLAEKRKSQGGKGLLTCVDKANVFRSMAFFRSIFDEVAEEFPYIRCGYNYVDAQALDLIRKPWDFDVIVTENMFGDILSDLAAGVVGGMGLASCAEVGDTTALFQPAHGSAPDIMGQDKANPIAAILSGALMLEYLSEKHRNASLVQGAQLIEKAVDLGFSENRIRPIEFGGDMGTRDVSGEIASIVRSFG